MKLYSFGHSNRSWEEFLAPLTAHRIAGVADVRAFPASRRWPQFNREALAQGLAQGSIQYAWLAALGGRRRRTRDDSPHSAWQVESFRNYADYMETAEFAVGLQELLTLAAAQPTAFLCAEALYWQCHRRLIADALTVAGHEVHHIQGRERSEIHKLTPFARVVDGKLIYDRGAQMEM